MQPRRARTTKKKATTKKRAAKRTKQRASAAPGATRKKAQGGPKRAAKPRAKRGSASLADFCRGLPGTTEDVKWGDNLIFSIGDKMYAGFEVENEHEYAFKCDEEDFDRLVERDGVIPAPYAAKYGWVKVVKQGALGRAEAEALLRKAHGLVGAGLSMKKRRELGLA